MSRLPNRLPSMMVALLAVALLTSCVVPVPVVTGDEAGSRENLGEAVPEFIASGKTTREEVLLSLGQADEVANDGSWLMYRSSRRTGGMVVFLFPSPVMPAFEEFEYRRLVVYFDEGGVVERTRFDKVTCKSVEWMAQGGGPGAKRRCFDAAGNELPPSPNEIPLKYLRGEFEGKTAEEIKEMAPTQIGPVTTAAHGWCNIEGAGPNNRVWLTAEACELAKQTGAKGFGTEPWCLADPQANRPLCYYATYEACSAAKITQLYRCVTRE